MRICRARHFRSRGRPASSRRARSSGPRRAAGRVPFRARRRRSRARAAAAGGAPFWASRSRPGPKREAQRTPRRRQSAKRDSPRDPPSRGAQRPGGERGTRGRASRWHSRRAQPAQGSAPPHRAARVQLQRLDGPVGRRGGGRLDREVRRRCQVGAPRAPAPATSCKNRRPAWRTRPAAPRAAIPSATESHSGFHILSRFGGRRVAKSGTFPLPRTRRPSPSGRNRRSEARAISEHSSADSID